MSTFFKNLCYFFYIRIIQNHFNSFMPIRGFLVNCFLSSKSANLIIRPGVLILDYKNLKIGNFVSINDDCFLSCNGGLTIGDNVSIGHQVSIITTTHSYKDLEIPIRDQPIVHDNVSIGSNVWIGAKVTILSGVSIPDGTIIAAGAVVQNSPGEENTIIGGMPARKLKDR